MVVFRISAYRGHRRNRYVPEVQSKELSNPNSVSAYGWARRMSDLFGGAAAKSASGRTET